MSGFLIVWILTPPNQIEVKYSHHECKDKSILIERTLKLAKIKKKKQTEKIEKTFAV